MVYEPISQQGKSKYYDMKGNMPKKIANIKQILAANLRENRRKRGLTQEKLAEMANMSLHYLATLELGNNFPSGEMLEKLAQALNIQAFQLFTPTATPEGALLHLEQSIVTNIKQALKEAVKEVVAEQYIELKSIEEKPKATKTHKNKIPV